MMNKMMKMAAHISAFLLLLTVCACSGNGLDSALRSSFSDGEITQQEWNHFVEIAKNQKEFIANGKFDPNLLDRYVREKALDYHRGKIKYDYLLSDAEGSVSSNASPINFKFFLERSGSMVFYDSPQCRGDFKSTLSKLLNSVPEKSRGDIYVVNSKVSKYPKSFKQFMMSNDVFADTKGYGDPSYTDFSSIFDYLLTNTGSNEVSILSSDMIYSLANTKGVNPQKVMMAAQNMATSVFKDHLDKSAVIVKLNADYVGSYYPFDAPRKGIPYRGNRPYYLLIVGKSDVLHRLFTEDAYKEFADIKSLPGFENYYCFDKSGQTPYYSVLLSNRRNRGRFGAAKDQGHTIHNLENVEIDDHAGCSVVTIAADLSGVITQPDYLLNKDNYEITSLSGYKIQSIEPISQTDKENQTVKLYAPDATHIITLVTRGPIMNETLTLALKNSLPQWIDDSNSEDDRNVHASNFKHTSFAFKHLMQGIYDAYFDAQGKSYIFKLNMNINN